jgi:hypothetical protein
MVSESSPSGFGGLEPASDRLRFIKTAERPSIAELFRTIERESKQHVVLTNGDILLSGALPGLFEQCYPEVVYYGHRLDVEVQSASPDELIPLDFYRLGFDYFILPPELVRIVNEERLLPESFRVGEPWWDYLVPLVALARGFPVKKIGVDEPLALHYAHEARYSKERWLRNGEAFLTCLARLRDGSFAEGLLSDLLALGGDLENKLNRISQLVCGALP